MNVWPLPQITYDQLGSVSESRPTALITQPNAWAALQSRLKLPLLVQAEPEETSQSYADYLADNLPSPVEAIYAVGTGGALDVAKWVAQRTGKPLVIVPTALSSSALLSPFAVMDRKTVLTGPARQVIFDFDMLREAPAYARAAGIVDVLAVTTALMDWSYALQKKRLTPSTKFEAWAASAAGGVALQATRIAESAGKGEPDGLRAVVDLLSMVVQIDNLLGHRRASQGVEHTFASALAAQPEGASASHAERVGPGILLASALFKKDVTGLRAALEAAGVRLNLIPAATIRSTFLSLPDYAGQHELPFGVLSEVRSGSDELTQALQRSTLAS